MLDKVKKVLKSYTFNICLVVGVTALVLWLTLKDNFNEVMGMFANINIWWLLVIILIALAIQAVIGWNLTSLTKLSNPQYKLSQGIINAFVSSFFCGITPSASGGQIGQVYVFKKQGIRISDSASVLWMDFIIYQAVMIVVVLVLLILRFAYFYSNFSNFFILVLLGFAINSIVIVGLWALVRFPKVYTWISTKGVSIGHKLHIIKDKEKAVHNLNIQLEKFDLETKKLRHHKSLILRVALGNVLRFILYYSIPFFCAKALGIEVHIWQLIDVMALSSYVSMINAFIPIPGASGGTEATFMLMFSSLFGSIGASSMMVLWRVATYYLILIIGGLVFIYSRTLPEIDPYTMKPMEVNRENSIVQ